MRGEVLMRVAARGRFDHSVVFFVFGVVLSFLKGFVLH